MNASSVFFLNFGKNDELYFNLLKEEDFNFKTKDINIDVNKKSDGIEVKLTCKSVLDLKIGSNALIKSLEIINKTLNI